MKIEELRVGNYVKYISSENDYCEITGVLSDDNGGNVYVNAVMPFDATLEDIEPIPLTEVILIKLGFEHIKECETYVIETSKDTFLVIDKQEEKGLRITIQEFGDYVVLKEGCSHLHQLQNLYFDLTGEELKLKK